MITPPVGVKSMLVSIDLPPLTAVTLAPFAEMSDYQAAWQFVCKLVQDRFARKPVKPVALDALRLQFPGNRKDTCDLRHFGVKGGIETSHLRKSRKMVLGEADDRQRRRNMQRRKGDGSLKLPQHRVINNAMLPKLRSAMHDSMPDRARCRHFGVGKKSSNADERFPLARNGDCLREQRFSARILRVDLAICVADRLGLAEKQHFGP
jgi:hypothetical protein